MSGRGSRIWGGRGPPGSPGSDPGVALHRKLGADGAALQHVAVLARQIVGEGETPPARGERGGGELAAERRQLHDILGERARAEEERAAGGGGDTPRLFARCLVIDEGGPVDGEAAARAQRARAILPEARLDAPP